MPTIEARQPPTNLPVISMFSPPHSSPVSSHAYVPLELMLPSQMPSAMRGSRASLEARQGLAWAPTETNWSRAGVRVRWGRECGVLVHLRLRSWISLRFSLKTAKRPMVSTSLV